jgi:hypothetical protein
LDKDAQQLAALIGGGRKDTQLYGDKILSILEKIMATLDDIVAKVKNESDVIDGAIVLINGFKDKLDAAVASGADPEVLQRLSDDIGSSTAKLAAAVAANTVAAPVDVPPAAEPAPDSTAPASGAVPGPVDAAPAPAPDQPAADPTAAPDAANPPT